MIDKAKRKTLKVLSLSAGAAAAAGSAMAMSTRVLAQYDTQAAGQAAAALQVDKPLANITLSRRVSVTNNDVEIVLTNSGHDATTITHITPAVTRVARGEFNFSSLLSQGPLTLRAGESVSVPLKRKAVKLWSASSNGATTPLSAGLRKSMSIVTEGSAFASVNIPDYLTPV